VEHFVQVERFPVGIAFPPDLALRIRHDPIRRRLVFQGFMSKREFDRLFLLSEDWSYRRALEQLFQLCTLDNEETRPKVFSRLRAILGLF
jgi:hypothetical protein